MILPFFTSLYLSLSPSSSKSSLYFLFFFCFFELGPLALFDFVLPVAVVAVVMVDGFPVDFLSDFFLFLFPPFRLPELFSEGVREGRRAVVFRKDRLATAFLGSLVEDCLLFLLSLLGFVGSLATMVDRVGCFACFVTGLVGWGRMLDFVVGFLFDFLAFLLRFFDLLFDFG